MSRKRLAEARPPAAASRSCPRRDLEDWVGGAAVRMIRDSSRSTQLFSAHTSGTKMRWWGLLRRHTLYLSSGARFR